MAAWTRGGAGVESDALLWLGYFERVIHGRWKPLKQKDDRPKQNPVAMGERPTEGFLCFATDCPLSDLAPIALLHESWQMLSKLSDLRE